MERKKVIWLPHGIFQDETNEHIDNVCAFVRPGEVVLAWTDDREDRSGRQPAALEVLGKERDARGRKIRVHKLPIPKIPVRITEEELSGFSFEEGEDMREAGERLAASYVKFFIFQNGGVLVPQFGDEHDKTAVEILGKLFPERKMIPVYARPVIVGGGNIHCITQQIPLGKSLDRAGEEK